MTLKIIVNFRFTQTYRMAEVVRRYEGSSTKSSYLYENCRDIKIWCDLPTFWKSLGNKVPFWSKTVFLRQEVNYYMVYIAYYTELNMQICNYAKKTTHLLQNSKYAFAENLYGHFCPRRKAANFCHPVQILADNSGPKLASGLQASPVGRHAGFNFPFITREGSYRTKVNFLIWTKWIIML